MSRGFAAIGLHAPRNDHNVGGAMRAATCYGASLVVVHGLRTIRQVTDTPGTWRHIPVIRTAMDLMDMLPYDCVPVAVEIVEKARSLVGYTHPERAFYMFGPEHGSLPASLVSRCRDVVRVPTSVCMNLAATVNVVLYDRLAKRGE
jgi:tRNA(Leu) C34 or U34 (ribose-2'-O)-methylase TrmL